MQKEVFTLRKNHLAVNVKLLGFTIATKYAGYCHRSDVPVPPQVMGVFVGSACIRFAVFLTVVVTGCRSRLSVDGLFISVLGIGSVLGC